MITSITLTQTVDDAMVKQDDANTIDKHFTLKAHGSKDACIVNGKSEREKPVNAEIH